MNKPFKNIVLIGRPGVAGVPETLEALKDHLESHDVSMVIEKNSAPLVKNHKLPIVSTDNLPSESDLIIVVGGDGSLLNAAHTALHQNIPILGINRGRLGFLTDIHPDELAKVSDVLNGQYQEERRFFLSATLQHEDKIIHKTTALNDIVLLPGKLVHMIEFETYINDHFVCKQRADGLIVASPTGSTAYALSGGGPILHPKLDAIVLVSMFPHTLSSRPIVVAGDSKIEIIITNDNETSPSVSSDGRTRVAIPPGGKISIHKYPVHLRLIHPQDYSYYATLREKLGWERHASRA